MIANFRKIIASLSDKSHVDEGIVQKFKARLEINKGLTKDENETSHFCSFFLPVHLHTQSIFLVHHIKGNDWMPPGGHIDKGETPLKTVQREFEEELQHRLTDERIELFDLSVIDINNPHHDCKRHYDFWYLVFTDKHDFIYSKREFYTAGWFNFQKLPTIQRSEYQTVIQKLPIIF